MHPFYINTFIYIICIGVVNIVEQLVSNLNENNLYLFEVSHQQVNLKIQARIL